MLTITNMVWCETLRLCLPHLGICIGGNYTQKYVTKFIINNSKFLSDWINKLKHLKERRLQTSSQNSYSYFSPVSLSLICRS